MYIYVYTNMYTYKQQAPWLSAATIYILHIKITHICIHIYIHAYTHTYYINRRRGFPPPQRSASDTQSVTRPARGKQSRATGHHDICSPPEALVGNLSIQRDSMRGHAGSNIRACHCSRTVRATLCATYMMSLALRGGRGIFVAMLFHNVAGHRRT